MREKSNWARNREPVCLLAVQVLGCLEVHEVPMVMKDLYLCFEFLPGCASHSPGLDEQIGALCHGFHSSFQHPRGSWTWTLPDATCHLYTVGTKLLLWCICQELNGLVSGLTKKELKPNQTELPQHTTNTPLIVSRGCSLLPNISTQWPPFACRQMRHEETKAKTCMQELILQSSFAGTSIANGVLNIMLRLVTLTWLCWQTSASSVTCHIPVTPPGTSSTSELISLEALLSQLHTDSQDSQNLVPLSNSGYH